MKITDIKPNLGNPRLIKDDKFKKLCKSISEFPQMMELRPIVVDVDGVILGGNMRYQALKHNGTKDIPDEWVKRAEDLTEEEKKRFAITDNSSFGEYDWEMIANEWGDLPLGDWGLDVPKSMSSGEEDALDEQDYTEVFNIIIECSDEEEQEKIFNKLDAEGYKCRVQSL